MQRSSFLIGVLAAAAICLAACALLALPWFSALPAAAGAVTVLMICFALTAVAVARMFSHQPLRVASVMSLAFVPVLALATTHAFHKRFAVHTTPLSDWVGMAAAALCCFTLTAAVALAARRVAPARAARGMWVVALLAMVTCAALLLHPRHGLLQAEGSSTLMARDAGGDTAARRFEERRPGTSDEAFTLGRSCLGGRCFALVGDGEIMRAVGPTFTRGATLELRRAASRQELLLLAGPQVIAVFDHDLRQPSSDPTSAASVARLGAPTSFRWLALLALLGGAFALLWRRRLSAQLAEVEAAATAFVHDNGWWQIDGRASVMRPLSGLEPGPALAYSGGDSIAPYRGAMNDGSARVETGSKQNILTRLHSSRQTLDSVTCAWLCTLATPLLVGFALAL